MYGVTIYYVPVFNIMTSHVLYLNKIIECEPPYLLYNDTEVLGSLQHVVVSIVIKCIIMFDVI